MPEPIKFILGTYIRKNKENAPLGVRVGEIADVLQKVFSVKPGGPEVECYLLRYSDGHETLVQCAKVEPGEFTPAGASNIL